jgi:hypothetical protein
MCDCDYIYLDGRNCVLDADNYLNWELNPNYFRNKNQNLKKVSVSLQTVQFIGNYVLDPELFYPNSCDIVTNLNFKNYYSTSGIKSLCIVETYLDDAINTLKSEQHSSLPRIKYETDIPSQIQIGILFMNTLVNVETVSQHFRLLLKFDYE